MARVQSTAYDRWEARQKAAREERTRNHLKLAEDYDRAAEAAKNWHNQEYYQAMAEGHRAMAKEGGVAL